VLHFGSQEVIWQCQNARRSESGCSDKPLGRNVSQTFIYGMAEDIPYWKLAEDPRQLWYRTVQQYSRLQLTFEEDKMPALAALTQNMETLRVDDRFLAGLWEKTLLLDLLWMVLPLPTTGRLATWRAPTWSWACVESQVCWGSDVDYVLSSVEVVDIHYVTTGPACMGKIQEASITLRVPLLRAGFERGRLCLDSTTPLLNDITIYDQSMDYDFSVPGLCHISVTTEVFIAPIGIDKLNCRHTGIVLLKRQDSTLYERVGYAEIRHREVETIDKEWSLSPRIFLYSKHEKNRNEKIDIVTTLLIGLPVCTVTII
jgi:hypothetical protein